MPPKNHVMIPTAALSASGSWVEGPTFLSACLQAPRFFYYTPDFLPMQEGFGTLPRSSA